MRQPRHVPAKRPQLVRRIAMGTLAVQEVLADRHLLQRLQIHLIEGIRLLLRALILQLLDRLRHKALRHPLRLAVRLRRQALALDLPALRLQLRHRLAPLRHRLKQPEPLLADLAQLPAAAILQLHRPRIHPRQIPPLAQRRPRRLLRGKRRPILFHPPLAAALHLASAKHIPAAEPLEGEIRPHPRIAQLIHRRLELPPNPRRQRPLVILIQRLQPLDARNQRLQHLPRPLLVQIAEAREHLPTAQLLKRPAALDLLDHHHCPLRPAPRRQRHPRRLLRRKRPAIRPHMPRAIGQRLPARHQVRLSSQPLALRPQRHI